MSRYETISMQFIVSQQHWKLSFFPDIDKLICLENLRIFNEEVKFQTDEKEKTNVRYFKMDNDVFGELD